MNVHTTHAWLRETHREERQTDLATPKFCFKWQQSLYQSSFNSNGVFFSDIKRSKVLSILRSLKQLSDCLHSKSNAPKAEWLRMSLKKKRRRRRRKGPKSHVVSPNCALGLYFVVKILWDLHYTRCKSTQ